MQNLKQLISFMIIFQLCYACNGGGGSSSIVKSGTSSTVISFQGSLASVIHSVSDAFISNAVAQDGTIEVMDLTDPNAPVSLGTFDVEDESQGYSFEIKSSKIKGKVISIEYEGGDKSIFGKRSMILEVDNDSSSVQVEEMNSDSTLQSQVLLSRLQEEGIGSLSDLKKRFKELHPHKEQILQQIKELALTSSDLKDYIEGAQNSLAVTIAAAWVAGIDGDDYARQEAIKKFNDIVSNVAPDLIGRTKLFCDDTNTKFSSHKEGSFRVYAAALSEELKQAFGNEEFLIGEGTNQDEVNKSIVQTIKKFNEISAGYKINQVMSISVRDKKSGYDEACKISSGAGIDDELIQSSYFDLKKIQSYIFPEGTSYKQAMEHLLWNIHPEIKMQGEAKIQLEIDSGNLSEESGKALLYEELVKEMKVLNSTFDRLDKEHNLSEYKINITELRNLSCPNFGSFDEFHDSLQAHEQKSYQRYVNTFGDSGSDDFYSQIDILKQTRETQKRICEVYFK